MKTVNDLYTLSSSLHTPLLSRYTGEFWTEYISKFSQYDSIFMRMFYSFAYFLQKDDETVQEVLTHFTDDVENHLLINDKKYSELYRIHVIDDSKYSITDNYNVKEVLDRTTSDTDNMTYGEKDENTTLQKGNRTENLSNSTGAQTNNITSDIAGFNSASYSNDNKTVESIGSRNDTSQTTYSSYTDTSDTTYGEHSDSKASNGTEHYILTKIGNIGVKTQTEVMKEHKEFWSEYDFYTMIFKEICAELLLI